MSHSIRLRGPWEFSIAGTQVAGRIEFPCPWSEMPATDAASITLRRHFHLPTGLDPNDRVVLVLRCQSPQVKAQLNSADLAWEDQPDGSQQADVTRQLSHRNELTIDLAPPCPASLDSRDAVLEVALEIEPAT